MSKYVIQFIKRIELIDFIPSIEYLDYRFHRIDDSCFMSKDDISPIECLIAVQQKLRDLNISIDNFADIRLLRISEDLSILDNLRRYC